MIVGEIIDLDNHNEIVKFMKNQSDKIKKLEEENEQLKLLNNYLTELLKDLNGVSIEIEKVME